MANRVGSYFPRGDHSATWNEDHRKQGEQLLKSGNHSASLDKTKKMQRAMRTAEWSGDHWISYMYV